MSILKTALGRFGGSPGLFLINRSEIEMKIDLFEKQTLSKMKDGVRRMALKAASLVQDKTPVDQGALKASVGDYPMNLKKEGNTFTADVGSNLDYTQIIEFGIPGKTYTYHKINGGNVTGQGAGMFRKTFDSVPDKKLLERILIDALK